MIHLLGKIFGKRFRIWYWRTHKHKWYWGVITFMYDSKNILPVEELSQAIDEDMKELEDLIMHP